MSTGVSPYQFVLPHPGTYPSQTPSSYNPSSQSIVNCSSATLPIPRTMLPVVCRLKGHTQATGFPEGILTRSVLHKSCQSSVASFAKHLVEECSHSAFWIRTIVRGALSQLQSKEKPDGKGENVDVILIYGQGYETIIHMRENQNIHYQPSGVLQPSKQRIILNMNLAMNIGNSPLSEILVPLDAGTLLWDQLGGQCDRVLEILPSWTNAETSLNSLVPSGDITEQHTKSFLMTSPKKGKGCDGSLASLKNTPNIHTKVVDSKKTNISKKKPMEEMKKKQDEDISNNVREEKKNKSSEGTEIQNLSTQESGVVVMDDTVPDDTEEIIDEEKEEAEPKTDENKKDEDENKEDENENSNPSPVQDRDNADHDDQESKASKRKWTWKGMEPHERKLAMQRKAKFYRDKRKERIKHNVAESGQECSIEAENTQLNIADISTLLSDTEEINQEI